MSKFKATCDLTNNDLRDMIQAIKDKLLPEESTGEFARRIGVNKWPIPVVSIGHLRQLCTSMKLNVGIYVSTEERSSE